MIKLVEPSQSLIYDSLNFFKSTIYKHNKGFRFNFSAIKIMPISNNEHFTLYMLFDG